MNLSESNVFLKKAIDLARDGVSKNIGGPFGALIVKDNIVIGEGCNSVTSANDPTAHAEINAIRQACEQIGSYNLEGCDIYCTCEPCPMCLGAIYWARIDKIYFASDRKQASKAGFDDAFLHDEFQLPSEKRKLKMHHLSIKDAEELFVDWLNKNDKKMY